MANRISTILDLDGRSFSQQLQGIKTNIAQADTVTGKFRAGFGGLMDSFRQSPAAQASVASGLAAIGAASIAAASNLEESVNAVKVSYGEASDAVLALNKEASTSYGLSQSAFNSFAVQFSSFAQTVAGEGGDVAGTVDELTTRVADFASVMNLDVPEAAQIFQSALAGETEPIRRFGIDLSAAAVSAHAVATGIAESAASMTEAQKVQARYSLLMQSTNKVQGDFAETSEGLANSTRIAKAQLEDLSAQLGKYLIPQVAEAASTFTDLIAAAEQLQSVAEDLPGPLGDIAEELDAIALAAARGPAGFKDLFDAMVDVGTKKVELDEVLSSESVDGMAKKFNSARQQLRDFFGTITDATGAMGDLTQAGGYASDAERDYIDLLEGRAQDARESAIATAREQRDVEDQVADAYKRTKERIDDLIGAQAELVGGDIAVRQARRDATEAAAELDETIANLNATEEDQRTTEQDLAADLDAAKAAYLDAAAATTDYEVATLEAGGAVLSEADKNRIMAERLGELAAALAPDSPLRVGLQEYIDQLLAIPAEVNTRFSIDRPGNIRSTGSDVALRTGGPIPGARDRPVPIVAHGGEFVLSADVVDAVKRGQPTLGLGEPSGNAPWGAGVGVALGGPAPIVINNTIYAGLGANGGEIGRLIVEEIKKYERRNGPGWLGR